MTDEAKEARRAYLREWARKNRDRVRQHQERHWEKVAATEGRANGQQATASATEQAVRKSALQTQGRKGCKLDRINMAFTTENYEYIRETARMRGETMTEFVNDIIAKQRRRDEDPLGIEDIIAFISERTAK